MTRERGYLDLGHAWCEVERPFAGQVEPWYLARARLLPGYRMRTGPHRPGSWLVFLLRRAPGELRDGRAVLVTPPDAALLLDEDRPGTDWRYTGDGRGEPEATVVYGRGAWFARAAAALVRENGPVFAASGAAALVRRLHLLLAPRRALPLVFAAAEAMALGIDLLQALRPEADPARSRLAAAARARLDRHGDEPLVTGRLARDLGVTREHLTRAFRRAYGLTPVDYHQRRRLRHAAGLLASSDLPLKRIALASGYGSAEAFARAFLRASGRTPTQYRRAPRPW